jgi:predicted nucleic acid-binding protein
VRYVLDCSVALKWFFQEPLSDVATRLLEQLQRGDADLVAPDCIIPELGHSCRKLVLGHKLSAEESYAAIEEFAALPIALVPSRVLGRQAMELAIQHLGTFYDALYIALAEREDLKVITADDRMANAFARVSRTVALANFE